MPRAAQRGVRPHMGYTVSIIRTGKSAGQRFARSEYEALCDADPKWTYDAEKEILSIESGNDSGFWLDADETEMSTKEPTEHQIELMLEVATFLGARVRGDDFETYRTPTETYDHPDDEELRSLAGPLGTREPSSREKVIRWIKIGALMLLALNFIAYVVRGLLTSAA